MTPTALQLSIFSKILNPDKLDNIIQDSTAESLALINMLTKISNSPILLKAVADKAKSKANHSGDNVAKTTVVQEAVKLLPEGARVEDVSLSGQNSKHHRYGTCLTVASRQTCCVSQPSAAYSQGM